MPNAAALKTNKKTSESKKRRPAKSISASGKKRKTGRSGAVVNVTHAPKILKPTPAVPELGECPRRRGVALPALFDKTFVERATKDELLTTCESTGLLGNIKSRKRTVGNMRNILAEQREELVKKLPLDKPVVLLKNAGKHTFYRVTVSDSAKKDKGPFELKVEWGATGMKRVAKFDEEKNMFRTPAPKKQTTTKFFDNREEAEAAARKLIQSKDAMKGYYLTFADGLAGMDPDPATSTEAKLKKRKLQFSEAYVQPFDNTKKVKDVCKETMQGEKVKSKDA